MHDDTMRRLLTAVSRQKLIIAVDFDGTCVTHEYPNVGRDIGAQPVLRALSEEGVKLILWTMRSGLPLTEAVDWFMRNQIKLFGINNNPDQHTWTQSPKAYAHVYIDDAAVGVPLVFQTGGRPFVDWSLLPEVLLDHIEERARRIKTTGNHW